MFDIAPLGPYARMCFVYTYSLQTAKTIYEILDHPPVLLRRLNRSSLRDNLASPPFPPVVGDSPTSLTSSSFASDIRQIRI